jgi:RNA polymerase sigma-70 factor, ECF subfamily
VIGADFADVLMAAQAGSEAAFSRLWRDGNPALLRYLRVMAPDVAEDVAASTWLRVVRSLVKFSGDEQAWRAWLFTIARRQVIDEARRRSRRPAVPLDDATELPPAGDAADIALEHLATRAALALVARLPAIQAEVIMLRVVAGLDTDTVARLAIQLGAPPRSAPTRLVTRPTGCAPPGPTPWPTARTSSRRLPSVTWPTRQVERTT